MSEISDLRRLLVTTRLVTLTGSGGSGKTRLALELAARVTDEFPGGQHWVELGALTDDALVAEQVAEALEAPARPGQACGKAVATYLAGERTLLVLDNCEHVVQGAADLVDPLLRVCPSLVILATSREALAVPGETAWLVPPLSLPETATPATPESVSRSEAVRLFMDRAADVVPSFQINAANAADIAAICRRLDGIPLALELAAARLRSLGPAQLLARLDDRFHLLTTRTRATLSRHRTLRAAIDWSYDLLRDEERLLLNRLSVFAGTFDLEAAEYVCADDPIAYEDVLDLLAGLAEKSLIEVLEQGSHVRYRLLESVRQYAAERLAETGLGGRARRQHVEYFLTLAETAEPHFTQPGRRAWIDRLSRDGDDIRQALVWTRSQDMSTHARLVGLLGWYWFGTGAWGEGRRWLEGALALPDAEVSERTRAALLFALGVLTALQGQSAIAQEVLTESLEISERRGDARGVAYSNLYLGLSLAAGGESGSDPPLEAALAHFQEHDDLYGVRLAMLCLGASAAAAGTLDRAAELTEGALKAAREFRQDREIAVSLRQLAMVELRRGDPLKAASLARDAVEALGRDPQHYFVAMSVETFGAALTDLGRPADGARLFGAGERLREEIGVAVANIDIPVYDLRRSAMQQALGEAAFAEAWGEGRGFTLDDAIRFCLDHGADLVSAPPPSIPPASPPSAPVPLAERRVSQTAAGSKAALDVRALGTLEIDIDERPIEPSDWTHARPRELLLFLLFHPAGVTRQEVGAAIWPDSTPAQVKNSFHVALHHLRKVLGDPEWVHVDNDRYRIDPARSVRFDVVDFERRVVEATKAVRDDSDESLARLQSTLALYRGDLLSEEVVGDWHLERRDHLRFLHVEAMMALGEALFRRGSIEEAVDVCRRVVLADDLHELAHRHLMVGLARLGQRQMAIRHFERLAAVLRDDLSAEPEAETVDLHRRILAAEAV